MRAYHLLCAVLSLVLDRRRYRRPRRATLLLAAVAAEWGWMGWRHIRRGRAMDRVSMSVDAVVGAAAVIALAGAVNPDEQFSSVNWAMPMNIWTCIGLATGFGRPQAFAVGSAVTASYQAAAYRQVGTWRPEVLSGSIQYLTGVLIGDVVVRRLRRNASEISELNRRAAEQAALQAEASTRSELNLRLHQQAIFTLRQIREVLPADRVRAAALARTEASRLRRALRGEAPGDTGHGVDSMVAEAAGRGLSVDLIGVQILDDRLSTGAAELFVSAAGALLRSVGIGDEGSPVVIRWTINDQQEEAEMTFRARGAFAPVAELDDVVEAVSALKGQLVVNSSSERGVRAAMRLGLTGESDFDRS